jgi:hypothetical protein
MNKKIQAETLKKFASTFEKLAQIGMENTDPAAPVINELVSFTPGDGSYFDKAMFDVLQTAATNAMISEGNTFNIGFSVGQGNVAKFELSPANPGVQSLLNKKIGPIITSGLNKRKIDGSGFVKNNWLSGWGWV